MATPVRITAAFDRDKNLQSLHAVFYDVDHEGNVEGRSCQAFLNNYDGSYNYDFYYSDDNGKKITDPNDKRVVDNSEKINEEKALENIMSVFDANKHYKPFLIEIVEFGKETVYRDNGIKQGVTHLHELLINTVSLSNNQILTTPSGETVISSTKPAHQPPANGFGFSSN